MLILCCHTQNQPLVFAIYLIDMGVIVKLKSATSSVYGYSRTFSGLLPSISLIQLLVFSGDHSPLALIWICLCSKKGDMPLTQKTSNGSYLGSPIEAQ